MKIALVEKNPTNTNYNKFIISQHPIDKFFLSEEKKKKLLKKDITLDTEELSDYDYIILVGAEPCKNVANISSVTVNQGTLIEGKYIPMVNPALLKYTPQVKFDFERAVENINKILSGKYTAVDYSSFDLEGIQNTSRANKVLKDLISSNPEYIALDTETTALYPRDGYILGISISWAKEQGVYIDTECFSEETEELLQKLFNSTKVVFHNYKFDKAMLQYHFLFKFPDWEDTLLLHYCLNENPGTHSLKDLALKHTNLGDYDKPLDTFKREYCRKHKVKLGDFTYDLIPFDIIYKYAAIDTAATFELFPLFKKHVYKDKRISWVYENILKEGTEFLLQVENNGVPFSEEYLDKAQQDISKEVRVLEDQLFNYPEIKKLGEFNPGSPKQLQNLFFNILNLTPVNYTEGGDPSTDAETLQVLSEQNEIADLVLKLRKLKKIKSTYIDKIKLGIDYDGRLRTNFNLVHTTSGRLSSSGKLNLQQLPRDNKIVKDCIRPRHPENYCISSMDLQTAEMYVAARLSGDKKLQNVFISGGDFHSAIAKQVFNLPCPVEDVKDNYGDFRQAAKAVSFGILFGSGPDKVAETAGISLARAKEVIKQYFSTFNKLDAWLKEQKDFIKQNGYTYSIFGRKRRLKNITSTDRAMVGHEIRSGVNFLIQSVASDIIVLAAIELQKIIVSEHLDAKIIMLVHDSIVAEVNKKDMNRYLEAQRACLEFDRGANIPNQPIGLDVEIGESYAFNKEC